MRVFLAAMATIFMVLLANFSPAKASTSVASEAPGCAMLSEGIYDGAWVKHRIAVEGDIVYGANDLDSILSQLDSLRGQGLCR